MNNMDNAKQSNWYAFYTRSRAEKQVLRRLEDQHFEVFLPLMTRIKLWSDRKKKVKVPLIRSYIFVRIGIESMVTVLEVPGIVAVLKYLGQPAIVRDEEIENLKILVNGEAEKIEQLDKRPLDSGDPIEVINGPFRGLIAEYTRMQGKYRVIVKIEALGTAMSVDIPRNNIKKI
jgi:transcription antitermination factor NusG